jgi:protein gp37
MPTQIEWADETWEIVRGCTKVSPGCQNCYAERMAKGRLKRFYPEGFHYPRPQPEQMEKPLHWQRPRRIFVASRSDWMHGWFSFAYRLGVLTTAWRCPQHQFLTLTKRVLDLVEFAQWARYDRDCDWPENVWAGVSVESQDYAWRLDELAKIPAKVRFVSLEPLLGPVDLSRYLRWVDLDKVPVKIRGNMGKAALSNGINWVIIGGESGPDARPMHPDWVRSVRDQCREAGVPLFVKQASGPRPGMQGDIPNDLWAVKEYPS